MIFQSFKKLVPTQYLLLPFVLFLLAPPLSAQNFDQALNLYENEQYEEAIAIFDSLQFPEAQLFSGKSYYSLGRYGTAKAYLSSLPENASTEVAREAAYTTALSDFHLNQFGSALNTLYPLKEIRPRTQLVNDANTLYNGILDYLTLAQRKEAFQSVQSTPIKADLIRSAFGKVDYNTAKMLLEELKRSVPHADSTTFADMEQMVADSSSYKYNGGFTNRLSAPRGIVYDIGAVLPSFSPSSSQFQYSRGLYQGYLLAAEEFNQRNVDKKAFIRYQNSGADMDSAALAMNHLIWSNNTDAVLGPLYSQPAMRIANLAEQYQVPLLAPLANSDSLNIDNPFVFQANPTFASHGTKMAQFAVNQLNMDTLAVFTERNSRGSASAYAFRAEAERLGAHISHFLVENLAERGYEITEFTDQFAPDTVTVRKPNPAENTIGVDSVLHNDIDAIYAPFIGQAASTLIDLLLIDLEVMESNITILGSQEWGNKEIPPERLENRSIYFSESYYINSESDRLKQFREEYKQRFGTEASRYALIGYDSADLLLRILEDVGNPALLKDAIKSYPLYEGLISNIKFDGTHVNQEVKIFEITGMGIQPAVY